MADSEQQALEQRRRQTQAAWEQYRRRANSTADTLAADPLSEVIRASWRRSDRGSGKLRQAAPLTDSDETRLRWRESPLRRAAQRELSQLAQLCQESQCVVALADVAGRLLWTRASAHMESRASALHFVDGGCWQERHTGTNAIGLSLSTREPCSVFAAEHYNPSLHEWVCYASPIIHPHNGELLGVLDISSTWERHNPMGLLAINGVAQAIAAKLPLLPSGNRAYSAELQLRLLGQPKVSFNGATLFLSLRQLEILTLLCMHPDGIALGELHAALYGDAVVTKNTLKSEISKLRAMLQGGISSRPYRLSHPFACDFIELWQALKRGQLDRALQLYRGCLLPDSNSPEIEQWRNCLDAALDMRLHKADAEDILHHCSPTHGAMIRERLASLLDP